jgi:hypothetical protein
MLLYALAFLIYYERIMFAEEKFLHDKFEDAYIRWASQTPALMPKLRNWQPPELPFSIKAVIKKEYRTVFLIIIIFASLEVCGDLFVMGKIVFDSMWVGIFAGGLLFFVVVRILCTKSSVFDVTGR